MTKPFAEELRRGPSPRVRIVTPTTRNKEVRAGWTEPGESKEASFEVRTYGRDPVKGTVSLLSTRGGRHKMPLRLGERAK